MLPPRGFASATVAAFLVGLGHASPLAAPTVTLDSATITGTSSLSGKASKFLGIPFAQPPVGDLRFRLPKPIDKYTESISATDYGFSCPQQAFDLPLPEGLADDAIDFLVNTIYGFVFEDSEDCLTINVIKPANVGPTDKLPVVAWIFGGGFEIGGTAMYDGTSIVERSIALGEPIIYVSMNYRVTGFGFLASKEVKEAGVGNLGLQDQREGLRWIQKYVGKFGGDPTKVTIWGESAGAISASLQMLTNGGDTEGLFRGAFMQSGSPIPVGDITNGQKYYDAIVDMTGCADDEDTLDCLRTVPYEDLKAAIDVSPGIFSYQSLLLAWLPRADGVFLEDKPQQLVIDGKVANIPIVSGDCDDEGTLFSLSNLNVTTDDEIYDYLQNVFLPAVPEKDIRELLELYPNNITKGSPFDTGIFNALTSQFKRIAAFLGDAVFQSPRRLFLQQLSGRQNIWSFLNKRLKGIPALGAAHGTDILNVYYGGDMADYLINFVNNLDPNGKTRINWPKYTASNTNLLTFLDGLIPLVITKDDYRVPEMEKVQEILLEYAI